MTLKGNQGFKYDPGSGEVEVQLNFPLYWRRPARSKRRWENWSLSLTSREVLVTGDAAVDEMWALVRFADQPIELLDALEAGADGVDLDYYTDLSAGSPYPSQLIAPVGDILELIRDRSSRGALGEFETEIGLRRVDGGNFDDLFGVVGS